MKNNCPNPNTPEWKRLIKEHDGNEEKALEEWNKSIPLFDEDLETNDDSVHYTDSNRIYQRTSSALDAIFPETRETPEEIAEKHFDGQETFTTQNHLIDKKQAFTKPQYVEYLKQLQEIPKYKGKIIHKLIENAGKLSYKQAKNMFPDITEAIYNESVVTYLATKDLGVFTYAPTDTIHREKTVALDLELREGDKILNGVAGTIDEYIEHDDGTVTIRDFKSGQVSSYQIGLILKEYGKDIKSSKLNKAKLQLTFYAVMLKLKNPALMFKSIEILKLPSVDEETELHYDVLQDLRIFLPVVEAYLKKHAINYNLSPDFFNHLNYIAKDAKLSRRIEVIGKQYPKLSLGEVKEKVKQDLLLYIDKYKRKIKKLQSKANPKKEDLDSIEEFKSSIHSLLIELDELLNGYSTINTGAYKKNVDGVAAIISDKYRATNPLAKTFIKLVDEAWVGFNKYMSDIKNEIKLPKVPNTSNYKEAYSWFWEGGDVVTFKDKKWETLTQEQKEYADYYRWTMRYELFKTMNPKMGYDFINAELKERKVWDGQSKEILEEQLKLLSLYIVNNGTSSYSFNKFNGFFKYYEGWTYRVGKSSEEMNLKDRVNKTFDSIYLTEEELREIELAKVKSSLQQQGIQLNLDSEGANGQLADKYTYNPTIIFSSFINKTVKKRHFDDAINVGTAINNFLEEENKRSESDFYDGVIKYINNQINSAILKKKANNELPSFKAHVNRINQETGEKERMEVTVSTDKIAAKAKGYFSFVVMAYKPLAAIRRGISGTITLGIHGIASSLSTMAGVKNVEFTLTDAASSWHQAWLTDEKTLKMVSAFGILPESYEDIGGKNTLIKKADPYLYNTLTELGFSLDRLVDNANFITTMIAQLKAMKLANGKSMWDSYEIINGKLVYTGEIRGIDSISDKEIKGLTVQEITRLKALSTKMYGAYRQEERTGLELSTIGSLFMQFKKYLIPMLHNAFAEGYQSDALGKYQEVVIDGKTKLQWQPRYEEGFIRTMFTTMIQIAQQKNITDVWSNLKDEQKHNIIFGTVKVALFVILGKIVASIFGDDDDDDKNIIKRYFNQIKREVISEFDLYNIIKSLGNVPTIDKVIELIHGTNSLVWDSIIKGERIESGIFKDGYFGETIPPYKGIPQLMKNFPVTSTVWSLYREMIDLEKLPDSISNDTYRR